MKNIKYFFNIHVLFLILLNNCISVSNLGKFYSFDTDKKFNIIIQHERINDECPKAGANYSEEEIKKCLGEPVVTSIYKSCKILKYPDGLLWKGITFIIILPIPLIFPISKSERYLYFKSGELIGVNSAHWAITHMYGIHAYAATREDMIYFGRTRAGENIVKVPESLCDAEKMLNN